MLCVIATIQKKGHTGGTVECTVCGVRWECETVCKCSGCEKIALCDAEGGEENAYCVACLTYMGDGVNHSRGGCDGPRYDCRECGATRCLRVLTGVCQNIYPTQARERVASICDDAAARGDVAGLRVQAARWAKRAERWSNAQARLIGESMENRANGIRYRLAGRIVDASMMERLSQRQIAHLRHTTGGR